MVYVKHKDEICIEYVLNKVEVCNGGNDFSKPALPMVSRMLVFDIESP